MRVLVCGGREYNNYEEIRRVLDHIHKHRYIDLLINGAALGADKLSSLWADRAGVHYVEYLADWNAYGRGAGHVRNHIMLEEGKPHLVIAFPGGKGTQDMKDIALKAGIEVLDYEQTYGVQDADNKNERSDSAIRTGTS